MPVSTVGKIVVRTHDAVCSPGHDVGNAGSDREPAARAGVRLDSVARAQRLYVPVAVALGLHACSAGKNPLVVKLGLLLASATTRAVRTRHEAILNAAYRAAPSD
jgi:hypothetical protein